MAIKYSDICPKQPAPRPLIPLSDQAAAGLRVQRLETMVSLGQRMQKAWDDGFVSHLTALGFFNDDFTLQDLKFLYIDELDTKAMQKAADASAKKAGFAKYDYRFIAAGKEAEWELVNSRGSIHRLCSFDKLLQ